MNTPKRSVINITFIITAIVGLSGWTKVLFDWYTSTPKIEGRVLGIITGEWQADNQPTRTSLWVYLYLVNERKNAVHILDYELEFDVGYGFERALRVYGTKNLQNIKTVFKGGNASLPFPDISKNLIYSKRLPVEYGAPLHGFALFVTNRRYADFQGAEIGLRVTCIDAFGNRHLIECPKDEKLNLYLLNDIADVQIQDKISNVGGN